MLINLGANINNANLKQVAVPRHHWSLPQLRFFHNDSNKRIKTPMKYADAHKLAHVVDKRYNVKRGNHTLHYNVPNHCPMALIRKDADAISHANKLEERRRTAVEQLDNAHQ